jgi:hypothetical protein
MTLSNLCYGDADAFSDDDGFSGNETAITMCGDDVEIVPQDADVLLGRGTKHQLHPGNLRYNGKVILSEAVRLNVVYSVSHTFTVALHQTTALLDLNRDRYIRTTSTFDKRVIIDEIVSDIVSNHGRFLKRVGNNKQWIAVSEATTRLKTAHAIQYRMRKKALTEDKPPLTDVLVSQCTKDTLPSKIALRKANEYFASCLPMQTTANKCSDSCDRCDQLEAYLRCLLSTRKSPSISSIEPTASSRFEQNVSVVQDNCDTTTGLASKAGRDAPWSTLSAPTKPVREVTVQAEEDPVDQLLKMRCNESFISLGPMDWSKSAGLNDSFTAAVEHGTVDLWSSMSFDDKALQSLASFSTLSIAPCLPQAQRHLGTQYQHGKFPKGDGSPSDCRN